MRLLRQLYNNGHAPRTDPFNELSCRNGIAHAISQELSFNSLLPTLILSVSP
jgi:hypothetical protein